MIGYVEEKGINKQELFRIEEDDMGQIIHRSIGAFTFLTPKMKMAVGSGVLISRDLILTSAQNFFDIYEGKENEDFKFYLGAYGTAEKYYELQSWRYPLEYTTCPASEKLRFDYALVKLKQPIEYKEFLEISFSCDACLMKNKQTFLKIFGYPSYGGNYMPLDVGGNKMKLSQFGQARSNRIKVVGPQNFKIGYAITTEPGQGGCPIVAEEKIIAIHSGSGVSGQQFNIGRLITPDLVFNLQKWCKQLNGSSFTINKQNLCPHLINRLLEAYIQISQLKKSEGQLKPAQDKLQLLPQNAQLQSPPKAQESPKQEVVVKQPTEEELQQIKLKLLQQSAALYKKGMDEWFHHNYSSALVYYTQCLQLKMKAVGEGKDTADIINWIAYTYLFNKDYLKAIEYYQSAFTMYEKYHLETCSNYTAALMNLVFCYEELKDFNSGVKYFEQRLLHNRQIKYQVGESRCAKSLVRILLAMGEKQRADELSTVYKLSL